MKEALIDVGEEFAGRGDRLGFEKLNEEQCRRVYRVVGN